MDRRPCLGLLGHVILALVYTTPWDNYLVAHNVWGYNLKRVAGILLGQVPIEEYTFFLLQTLMTGLWVIFLTRHVAYLAPKTGTWLRFRFWISALVGVLWALSLWWLVSGWRPGTYLSLILTWALVPIFIQVVFGGDILLANRSLVCLAVVPTTLYLWIVDALAIRSGIWFIDPGQITGLGVRWLPIEEMVFFFMTNLIIGMGMILVLSPASLARLRARRKDLRPVV